MGDMKNTIKRRDFIAGTAAVSAFTFVPGHVLGLGTQENGEKNQSANEKLNIAFIGAGGRAEANLGGLKSENVVALCDVDQNRAAKAFGQYPKAKRFQDFRKMLDKIENEIDAVVVSTPDHTHAVAAMNAIKRGKHVYCEKPLAHSIYEVRALAAAAREHKVATQLGNQGHSDEHIRMFCEWIQDGAIGTVREIHAQCRSSYSRIDKLDQIQASPPIPKDLAWDLWLGPTPQRSYNPLYLPGSWRSWTQFGTGVVGDWTCHVIDPVFWALDLGSPISVRATADGYDPKAHFETFPKANYIEYEFAARGERPAVKLIWRDGANKPPRPKDLESGREVPETGALVVGDKGNITYGSHGAGGCRIVPEAKMKAYTLPEKTIPRSQGHHRDWVIASKGGKPASSNFDYGAPLTEIALLGNIAIHRLGETLQWDGKAGRFTNSPAANALLKPTFRKGWEL